MPTFDFLVFLRPSSTLSKYKEEKFFEVKQKSRKKLKQFSSDDEKRE